MINKTRKQVWDYCYQSTKESLLEKEPHCIEAHCNIEKATKKPNPDTRCTHYLDIYYKKWEKFNAS